MRTVVGLFNNMNDAQCAVQALHGANFSQNDINFIAQDTNGDFKRYYDANPQAEGQTVADGTAKGAGIGAVLGGLGGLLVGLGLLAIPGVGPVLAAGPIATTLAGAGAGAVAGGIVGALVDLGIPEEHAKLYAEGIRRGGTLVTVRTPDDRSDEAVQLLEQCNPVDIRNQMKNNWQGMGMQGRDLNENVQSTTTGRDQWTTDTDRMDTDQFEENRMENIPVTGDQGVDIPVVEEEMNIGKRTVETGGVRIESYVREEPVEEDVELRQEHVNVERRPVNRDATDEDIQQAFQEGTMELKETEEQVVTEKRPKVVEEVHVNKDVDTETQKVRDTVRKTEVNVEHTGTDDFQRFNQDFRNHFDTTYASQGMNYNDFTPAYQYGYNLARDRRFSDYDWNAIEPEARTAWERRYGQSTWDRVRDAVHYAWDTARG